MVTTPYSSFPTKSFWSRGVSRGFRPEDLVSTETKFFRKGDKVVSAGSCFAANIVPYLEKSGFAYVRAEVRPSILRVPTENLGYDNFSASYGNIYTARQLLQLFYRAMGIWQPKENVWEVGGEFIDPFRPGLRYRARSREEFDALTQQHLKQVKKAFETASVFVFTLGLTEAWVSQDDGAVFPACPGTVAGEFNATRHKFHNMTVDEVIGDLNEFICEVRKINPTLRVILTVSPVPLVATATGGHVLHASIYSKSVLRVAAETVVGANDNTFYFPAYEIVTGPQSPADFFEADKRNVSRVAVETVMSALLANCELSDVAPAAPSLIGTVKQNDSQALSQALVAAECEEAMSDVFGPESAGS
ncbi:GSCFA domain-containing protein [Methylocystis sp. MitZ-2018]|nr:GSCFA domain-containing protein [Methylocystis sp. MitZ-2018]